MMLLQNYQKAVEYYDVAAKNSIVVAAAGTGGIKILELASPSAR